MVVTENVNLEATNFTRSTATSNLNGICKELPQVLSKLAESPSTGMPLVPNVLGLVFIALLRYTMGCMVSYPSMKKY